MTLAWIAVGVCTVVLLYTLVRTSSASWRRARVDTLILRLEIPVDDRIIALIDRRMRSTLVSTSLSGLVGAGIISVVFGLNGGQFPPGLAGWVPGLIVVVSMTIGEAVSAARQFAPQSPAEVRIARSQNPRLTDYLHPAWVGGAVGACALAVASSCAILAGVGGGFDAGEAATGLTLPGLLAFTATSIAGLLAVAVVGHRLLAIPQPARSELDLRWDDALRGMALRSIWIAALTLSWAALVIAMLWLVAPSADEVAMWGMLILVPFVLSSLPPSRRTEWYLWPDAGAEASADQVISNAP